MSDQNGQSGSPGKMWRRAAKHWPGWWVDEDSRRGGPSPLDDKWPYKTASRALAVVGLAFGVGALLTFGSDSPAAYGFAGGLVSVAAVLLIAGFVLTADVPIGAVQRIYLSIGCTLGFLWVGAHLAGTRVTPTEIFNSYLLASTVLVFASWTLSRFTRTSWLVGMAAAGLLLFVAASSLVGVLIEPIAVGRPAYVLVALFGLLAGGWSGFTLWREAGRYDADVFRSAAEAGVEKPPKGIELAIPTMLAVSGVAIGLWYTLIVGPVEDQPTLDVNAAMQPVHDHETHDQIRVEVTATNTSDARLRLMASPYTVSQAVLRPEVKLRQTTDAGDLQAVQDPAVPTSSVLGIAAQVAPIQARIQPIDVELLRRAFASPTAATDDDPGQPDAEATMDPRPTPDIEAIQQAIASRLTPPPTMAPSPVELVQNEAGSVNESAGELRLSEPDFENVHIGQAWAPGHIIEPGATISHSFLFTVRKSDPDIRILKLQLPLVFARSDRLVPAQHDGTCIGERLADARGEVLVSRYELMPIDPISGLLNSVEPAAVDVAVEIPAKDSLKDELRVAVCRRPDKFNDRIVQAPGSTQLQEILGDWGIGWVVLNEQFTARGPSS